jgi:hypothetical protein
MSKGAGEFAADYLRATYFTELVVEVDYAVGGPPRAAALDLLQDRLEERCDKPGGVTIVLDDAIADSEFPSSLDVGDLMDIEDDHRDTYSNEGAGVAAMYVLYVTGSSVDDGDQGVVLGLSYRGGSFALFADNVGPGNPFVTAPEVEGTGIVHEAGHLLGLVAGGCPMVEDHEDPQSPFHCDDASCVMYWQINVPFGLPNIGDPNFAQFDSACAADMADFGGLGGVPARLPPAADGAEPAPERVPTGHVCATCLRAARAARAGTAHVHGPGCCAAR